MTRGVIDRAALAARRALRDPACVRDALAMHRYAHLLAQLPMLYAMMIFVAIIAAIGLNHHAAPWIRFGIPALVVGACVVRLRVWVQRRGRNVDARHARVKIARMSWISLAICSLCSLWCILSWASAQPSERPYIAIFMAAGTLSVGYCLSGVRIAALANLIVGLAPAVILLVALGRPIALAAAASLAIAATFLVRMVWHQHDQLVALLRLQHEMRALAATDPLTGLANRRALYTDLARALGRGAMPAVALVDLDGFKPVNDCHGHAAGDALLRETAERLRDACAAGPGRTVAYRLGGDEFALLSFAIAEPDMEALANRVCLAMALPFAIAGGAVRVGASVGWASAATADADVDALVAAADRALYAAKADRLGPVPAYRPGRAA